MKEQSDGMIKQRDEMRKACKELLASGKVDLVLGFTVSDSLMQNEDAHNRDVQNKDVQNEDAHNEDVHNVTYIPCFARTQDEADSLEWNNHCRQNLARYLHGRTDRVAIVAKSCDVRAIVQYIAEKQIIRDQVYIIGMDCDINRPGCEGCTVRTPPVYDISISAGGAVQSGASNHNDTDVQNDTGNDSDTNNQHTNTSSQHNNNQHTNTSSQHNQHNNDYNIDRFQQEIDKCILCFSCRQACYGCYCQTCFIERGLPNWLPPEIDKGTKMTFHMGKAMHLAGRCVECGACETACSSDVKLRYIIKELTSFVEENYDFRTGMSLDDVPAMVSYGPDDRDIGFLGVEHDDHKK